VGFNLVDQPLEQLYLAARLAFAALLYLFLLLLLRAVRRDLHAAASPAIEPERPAARPEGRLVVVAAPSGANGREDFPLETETLIGRDLSCQVRLEDSRVSKRHALLRWSEAGWTVRDMQSTNGTELNGRPLRDEQALQYGDVLTLGETRLKLAR
jgi:pSer/pThr/pTyr-binding forkhead associated (FHA) protein